jgi:hypothetical protein
MQLFVRKNFLLSIVVFLLLIQGIIYFFYPADVHNSGSPFKYIKYILLLAFVALTFFKRPVLKVLYLMTVPVVILYYYLINVEDHLINCISYQIAFYFLLVNEDLRRVQWKAVVPLVIIVASFCGYYELLFLENHFAAYNHGLNEYRLVSIFINPNNLGITIAFLTFAYLEFLRPSRFLWLTYYANGGLITFFSGSKTALALYIFFTAYFVLRKFVFVKKMNLRVGFSDIVVILLGVPVVIFATFKAVSKVDFSQMRKFDLTSLWIRFSDYRSFFGLAQENVFFPWIGHFKDVDNIYLHLWGTFGLPAIIIWVLFNIYLLIVTRQSNVTVVLIAFMLTGFTTNFLYLWPLGYMYWGFVSYLVTFKIIARNNEQSTQSVNRLIPT